MTGPSLPDAMHDARIARDRSRMIDAAGPTLHQDPEATLATIAAVAGLSTITAQQLFADRDELLRAVRC